MLKYTRWWTENRIREVIKYLDEKTGLDGASLPIKMGKARTTLGSYHGGEPRLFRFSQVFLNDVHTREVEAIDLIRHEYAHYYVHEVGLNGYPEFKYYATPHGRAWTWACGMVGAVPKRCHSADDYDHIKWSASEAQEAYRAEDVRTCDIKSFIAKWNQLPMNSNEYEAAILQIQKYNPESFFKADDEVVHPRRGFGLVIDAIPDDRRSQTVHLRFEDKSELICSSREIWRVEDGVVIPHKLNTR